MTNMVTFQQGFNPLLNKEGFALCKYVAFEEGKTKEKEVKDKEGNAVIDEETGEPVKKVYEYMKIFFAVKGTKSTGDKNIPITIFDFTNSPDKPLYQLLCGLGFQEPDEEVVEDFEEVLSEDTIDDFDGVVIGNEPTEDFNKKVTDFLKSIENEYFLSKISKNGKGYWELDVTTLKKYIKKK